MDNFINEINYLFNKFDKKNKYFNEKFYDFILNIDLNEEEKNIVKILKENNRDKINKLIFDVINYDIDINIEKIESYINEKLLNINKEFIEFYNYIKNIDIINLKCDDIEKFRYDAKYYIIGYLYSILYYESLIKEDLYTSFKYLKLYPSFKSYETIIDIFYIPTHKNYITNFYSKKIIFLYKNSLKKCYFKKSFPYQFLYNYKNTKIYKFKYFTKKLYKILNIYFEHINYNLIYYQKLLLETKTYQYEKINKKIVLIIIFQYLI